MGIDFESVEAVEAYERHHTLSSAGEERALDQTKTGSRTSLLDLGSGLGTLVVRAAQRGARARGIDVSKPMLARAQENAARAGVDVQFQLSSILQFEHDGDPFDVVTARGVMHQLPDFWKQVAFTKIRRLLTDGGLFYMWDLAFSFEPHEYVARLEEWLSLVATPGDRVYGRETFEQHLREEYSTYTWILEGMIQRAGFTVLESLQPTPFQAEYLCQAT